MTLKTRFPNLQQTIQAAQMRVIGEADVRDMAQARTMTALLQAYGDTERGFCYAEPLIPDSNAIPDIVLAHPELGLLVIEVKAYDMEYIISAEAGSLIILNGQQRRNISPLRQAQASLYAIKDAFEAESENGERALFNALVALPNISELEWIKAGYETAIPRRLILFAEDLQDHDRLKTRVQRLIYQTKTLIGLAEPLNPEAEATLAKIFSSDAKLGATPRSLRDLPYENMGATIDRLQSAQAKLTIEQQRLVRANHWGRPYILRGVAGSGKTIVLAYHVAWAVFRQQRLHDQLTLFPEDRHALPSIAVLCVHRALVPLLKNYVQNAYRNISGQDLPPQIVRFNHLNGLIYELTEQHPHFHYIPINQAGNSHDRPRRYLEQLQSMRAKDLDELRFDAIFVDEGQDLHPDTLTMLQMLLRPNPKTGERGLSIYYDDAQNIYGHPRPTWRNFGINVQGGRTDFMRYCYRNSREIVELGLNVLLGTAADEITRINTRQFADVHNLTEKNLIELDIEGWRVNFAQASGDPPEVIVTNSAPEQADWVADLIVQLIQQEHVRPEDILIIAPKDQAFSAIERRVLEALNNEIEIQMMGNKANIPLDEPLVKANRLSFATIHAAKGYDAPIAIFLDADQLELSVTGRAMFYVAATRAKRYLWIVGVKKQHSLLSEALTLHKQLFNP